MTTLPVKIRSTVEAQEALERDIAPRRQELFNLKGALGASSVKEFVRKSALLLAFAHIEGAMKAGLTILFLRMNHSGLAWRDVPTRLAHFEIDWRLARIGTARRVISDDATTAWLRNLPDQPIAIDVGGLIGRVGVINAETLRRILSICEFEPRRYNEALESLDEALIARRHDLAHGSQVPVDPGLAIAAIDLALTLIESLLIDFSNLLTRQSWRGTARGRREISPSQS